MYSWKRLRDLLAYGVSKRSLVLVLALVTVLASVTGGTVALLYSQKQVTNVFTYGDINIGMYETDTGLDHDGDPNTNQYEMTPGSTIPKDPFVQVDAGSADCWLFVTIEESANYSQYLTHTIAEGWLPLTGYVGVYYREVDSSDMPQLFAVLEGNEVRMRPEATLEELAKLDPTSYPVLGFTAYAVQRDPSINEVATADSAWELLLAGKATVHD